MIPRRLSRLAPLIAALALLPALSRGAPAPADRPPNLLVILADDMGYGDPRCDNPESRIPTPNLDRLAAEGLRFTDAHTPSSVCSPTRYGLLTGRYSWRTRLKKGVLDGYSPLLIEPGRLTLPALLKAHGYRTAGIGKWHLGLGDAARTDYTKPLRPGPRDRGFDSYFGIPASLDMPPYLFFRDDRPTAAPTEEIAASEMRRRGGGGFWRAGPIAPGFRHEDVLPRLEQEAVAFLEGRSQAPDEPFFLYLALSAPHTPWMPLESFRGKSGAGYYGDFAAQVDATIGSVLAALDRSGRARETLVIVTSDNGAHWLPTDIAEFGHRANASWRGQKADIWEGGHRVPFLARWPGRVAAGQTCDRTVCLTDLLATAADLVGATLPDDAGEDSVSILPALLGQAGATGREAIVHHSSQGMFAIRQGPWKLALGLGSGGFSRPQHIDPEPGGPQGQLYNLEDDPAEAHNLYLERPEVVRRLTSLLDSYRESGRSRPAR